MGGTGGLPGACGERALIGVGLAVAVGRAAARTERRERRVDVYCIVAVKRRIEE